MGRGSVGAVVGAVIPVGYRVAVIDDALGVVDEVTRSLDVVCRSCAGVGELLVGAGSRVKL